MASKNLNTNTLVQYNQDNTVEIHSIYQGNTDTSKELPHIISSKISENITNYSGVNINEGDLYMFVNNYPELINVQLDNSGNLILFLSDDNEKYYSIDSETGDLMYEKQ